MRWSVICTIAWEFLRISTLMPAWCLEVEQQKWRFQPASTSKPTSTKESNNFLLELVSFSIYLVGYALEVIPKTLATNCGMDVVRIITELRAKHAEQGNFNFGIDGNNKKISDMSEINVW